MKDMALARQVFGCIDNTTLSPLDTDATVAAFCHRTLALSLPDGTHVAGVCVYPRFASVAAQELRGSGIGTVCVMSDFPHGQGPLDAKRREAAALVAAGADEVDMVINRGLVAEGRTDQLAAEVAAVKAEMGQATLKVILETCELNPAQIGLAAQAALEGGADFIKTSTGKGTAGATPEGAEIMLKCIKNYVKKNKKTVGFKAAGSIKTAESALAFAEMAKKVFGAEYVNKQTFRIGASSLTESMHALLTN